MKLKKLKTTLEYLTQTQLSQKVKKNHTDFQTSLHFIYLPVFIIFEHVK